MTNTTALKQIIVISGRKHNKTLPDATIIFIVTERFH